VKFGTDEQNTYYTLLLVDAGNFLLFLVFVFDLRFLKTEPAFLFFQMSQTRRQKSLKSLFTGLCKKGAFFLDSYLKVLTFLIFSCFLLCFPLLAQTFQEGRKTLTSRREPQFWSISHLIQLVAQTCTALFLCSLSRKTGRFRWKTSLHSRTASGQPPL